MARVLATTLEAATERFQVDLGLEREGGKRFALWALLHLLGSAPALDVAFKEERDRKAVRTSGVYSRGATRVAPPFNIRPIGAGLQRLGSLSAFHPFRSFGNVH